MQNVVLTQTAGGTTSVTIYATSVSEKVTDKVAAIEKPSSSRGTANIETLIIALQRTGTRFAVRGHIEDELRATTTLSHTATVTTITVNATGGFATSGLVKVEQELISYTGTTSTTFTGCTRGVEGTVARSHASNVPVLLPAAQFRDDLFTIKDYGGCCQMAYRRKNWSVAFENLTVDIRPSDDESPRVFDVEFTVVVGQDRIKRDQSTNRVIGRSKTG